MMNTHCPQCGTQFRITEAQIELADGYVRCGVCEHVFNVFEVAGKSAAENIQQSSLAADDMDGEKPSVMFAETERIDEEQTAATKNMQDDSLDFFNEEVTRSLPHVVPEKFRKSDDNSKPSAISTVLWSIGTLALTATLLLEYIWFNRDQYYQSEELKAAIAALCQQFNCDQLSMRDPGKIELTARNIYTHPNEKNALMVDITIKNTAAFSQPFPVMNISFSDLRGNAVASRSFLPDEYLAIDINNNKDQQALLLQPNTSTSLTLEIQDPGKQATTYVFDFL